MATPTSCQEEASVDLLVNVLKDEINDAIYNDDLTSIVALVQAHDRAVVNIRCSVPSSDLGMTSLHVAVRQGKLEYVKLLVARGALLNACELYGRTPLVLAIYMHYKDEEYSSMVAEWPTVYRSVTVQHTADYFSIADFLLKAGADVNIMSAMYGSALHLCAQCANVALAELLVSSGADVKATDRDKNTALHRAVMSNSIEMVTFLVRSRCDLDAKNSLGETPLHAAAKSRIVEMVKLLVRSGADVYRRNICTETALDVANRSSEPERFEIQQYLAQQMKIASDLQSAH
jgi:ankyrin repeat protein